MDFASFRLAEANAPGDLAADTSAVYSFCPLTSSVYLVLPDALILPAAPKGPLSREKVLTPFSVKAQHDSYKGMSERICRIERPRGSHSSASSVLIPMRIKTTVTVSGNWLYF